MSPVTRSVLVVALVVLAFAAGGGTVYFLHSPASHDAHGDDAASTLYSCGMHPHVLQEGPGRCPICGMDLTPVSEGEDEDTGPGAESWTCSMHPMIDEPEAGSCPICGMDLVRSASEGGEQSEGRPAVTIDPTVVQNIGVSSELVGRRTLHRELRALGHLDYDRESVVSVTTKASGFVERAFVHHVGERVAKGQPLFELYSPEVLQTQEELLSALRYANALEGSGPAAERARALVAAARQRLALYDVDEAQLRALEENGESQRRMTIHAPRGGVVMRRMDGLEGAALKPGVEALHIASLDTLWLRVEVYEDQLPWMRAGDLAELEFSALPGETRRARVLFVEPAIDERTRTAKLTLRLDNPDGRLRVGMYASVRFRPAMARDVIAIPSDAVLRTGTRQIGVVALGDGRFEPRELALGAAAEGWVEVRSGLAEGERIVTSAHFLIDSESSLRDAMRKMSAERAHDH